MVAIGRILQVGFQRCPTPSKREHFDQEDAEIALARALTMERFSGETELRTYLCDCGYWHIGHAATNQERTA